jgi:hypothetical protein
VPPVDIGAARLQRAVAALRSDRQFLGFVRGQGAKWGMATAIIMKTLPTTMVHTDRFDEAYRLVPPALDGLCRDDGVGWRTERRDDGAMWIVLIDRPGQPGGR